LNKKGRPREFEEYKNDTTEQIDLTKTYTSHGKNRTIDQEVRG
jgi:hypothetical protein